MSSVLHGANFTHIVVDCDIAILVLCFVVAAFC